MDKNVNFDILNLITQVTKAQEGVEQICRPILDFFKIRYFELYRVYPDNSFIILTTHPEWVQYYFSNHYFETTDTDCHSRLSQFDFILWEHWPKNDTSVWKITKAANSFKLTNTISIIQKSPQVVNAFNFGAPIRSEGIYNQYLTNMSTLEKFSHYFLSRAYQLIDEANKLKSLLPRAYSIENEEQQRKLELLDSLDIKNIPFLIGNKNVILSEKETRVVRYYTQGISAKHIARKLNLSHKTIEWHIDNIKKKLHCYSKSDLCETLKKNPYFHIY